MIEDVEGTEWCFRRDRRIRLDTSELAWRHRSGLLVLRPEIQLLYKAKQVRPQDQEDFDTTALTLGPNAREWLRTTMTGVHPNHPWLPELLRTASA
jgi:hypothetical protein